MCQIEVPGNFFPLFSINIPWVKRIYIDHSRNGRDIMKKHLQNRSGIGILSGALLLALLLAACGTEYEEERDKSTGRVEPTSADIDGSGGEVYIADELFFTPEKGKATSGSSAYCNVSRHGVLTGYCNYGCDFILLCIMTLAPAISSFTAPKFVGGGC